MSDTIVDPVEIDPSILPLPVAAEILEPFDPVTVLEDENELRLYCLIRDDLAMSEGKRIAQTGHAFVDTTLRAMQGPPVASLEDMKNVLVWQTASKAKIAKRVKNLAALERAARECEAAGINHVVITDEGRTEFGGVPTVTCMGLGPIARKDLPKFIERMRLY